jgi:hypothetical protein
VIFFWRWPSPQWDIMGYLLVIVIH